MYNLGAAANAASGLEEGLANGRAGRARRALTEFANTPIQHAMKERASGIAVTCVAIGSAVGGRCRRDACGDCRAASFIVSNRDTLK
jgi:hypothetical protein